MDKTELSRRLEQQVQAKLAEGYSITTYALDAASRDRLKRGLKPVGHAIPHENQADDEWKDYLHHLDVESKRSSHAAKPAPAATEAPNEERGKTGIWNVWRH
ncbi:hypothetical protein [Pseudomonas aeruginosa]|uniref:hypothetical protein n=1 Tax=Pseudomonas aeruginosa TaxID=287 RepID=UPI000B1C91A5|nr:hypothetical protein [Pseudomonas aeruginosa]